MESTLEPAGFSHAEFQISRTSWDAISWGFSKSNWYKSEPRMCLDLVNPDDYEWVYEIVMENRANRGKQGGEKS